MYLQIGLVASQFSLPMLAPLLFGTGILLRSIRTNASLIFPRIGVVVVLLWMLWFFNSVVQKHRGLPQAAGTLYWSLGKPQSIVLWMQLGY